MVPVSKTKHEQEIKSIYQVYATPDILSIPEIEKKKEKVYTLVFVMTKINTAYREDICLGWESN